MFNTSIHPERPQTQAPIHVYSDPALVCNRCGDCYSFGDYEGEYLDHKALSPCDCGGQYVFRSIRERYERDGVYFCSTLKRYYMTMGCPRSDCWSKACHLATAMAEKTAERLAAMEEEDIHAEEIAYGCHEEAEAFELEAE